ncbi:MAG: hypothetical protein ACI4GO_10240, partial [Hominenteromicrobium sp.]
IVYYYNEEAYSIEDYGTLELSISQEDYNKLHTVRYDALVLSIYVEDEYITSISFGDYRAITRLN